jgi:hypothetical protein
LGFARTTDASLVDLHIEVEDSLHEFLEDKLELEAKILEAPCRALCSAPK